MSETNLFKVSNFRLNLKDQQAIELMTVEVNLPSLTLGEITIGRPVVNDHRNGDSLTYDDLVVTVLCDETFSAWKEIYNYIMKSASPETGELDVVYPVFDSTLFLTTNKNNVQHEINFIDCFFKSISGLPLTSQSSEEEQITFTITLGYNYYLFK
jgi:hypothetical protein